MWFQLGVVFIVIAFLFYLGAAFGTSIGALIINGGIVFLIIYRSYYEIQADRFKAHIAGVLVAFAALIIFGNFGKPFWTFTTLLVVEYLVAVTFQLIIRKPKPSLPPKGQLRKV